jgi:two-component system sensor histidine kinase RegB
MTSSYSRITPLIALPWIVRLRYLMAIGQWLSCLAASRLLGIGLPLGWLAIPPAFMALSNIWLARRGASDRRAVGGSTLIVGVFVLDTFCLTATLLLSGGPNNPFSLLYLVHITLAASILTQRQTWALGALACLCFGVLFWNPLPIKALEMHPHGKSANLHLVGMWIAFAVASALVAMFSGRISEQLREREEALFRMREELAKKERLASLVTLAAGAAHELNTPLGTIAIVAKELEHYAAHSIPNRAVAEDSRLIRKEVDRCVNILQRMSIAGAEPLGEAFEIVTVEEILQSVRKEFSTSAPIVLKVEPANSTIALRAPRHAVEQALVALVKNGIDAGGAQCVSLTVRLTKHALQFEVRDFGEGIDEETLRRVGEPFFTTKDPGKGMGLGVFLVQILAERLGGRFALQSEPGIGTTATFELPVASTLLASAREVGHS